MRRFSTTHFGYRQVAVEEKHRLVGRVFDNVAGSYDLMNDLMSAGVHRLWKHQFVSALNPQPGMQVLDVAGGTGDIAFGILEALRTANLNSSALEPFPEADKSRVIVCDINPSMLQVGRRRAEERGFLGKEALHFTVGDAQSLPFDSNSFDAYTIAFGLRNVTDIDIALQEAFRVLKPGGRFLCLEFSTLAHPLLQQVYDLYSFNVIPWLGQVCVNDRESYQYLVESIRKFPNQEQLKVKIAQASFDSSLITFTNFSFGICAMHSAFKL